MRNANGFVLEANVAFVSETDFEPSLEPGQTSGFECLTDTPKHMVDSWTHEIAWQDESSSLLKH